MLGRTSKLIAVAGLVAGAAILQVVAGPGGRELPAYYIALLSLYLLPIIAAATWFEFRGTLVATALVMAANVAYSVADPEGFPLASANQLGLLGAYLGVGLIAGWLSRLEARRRRRQEAAERQLRRELISKSLASLSEALKLRDEETQDHSERVGELAGRIAKEMDLPEERVDRVVLAARVHDIGKIGIRDDVLFKEGKLTKKESTKMREHPAVAADIIRRLEDVEDIAEIVLSHHEALDGSGYPRGLKGDRISLEARIVTVADIYEALTEERSYKDRLSSDEALGILEKQRGTKVDGRVIDALCVVLDKAGRRTWVRLTGDSPRKPPLPVGEDGEIAERDG